MAADSSILQVYPYDYFVHKFNFLFVDHGFEIASVQASGPEVQIILSSGDLEFIFYHEHDLLPTLEFRKHLNGSRQSDLNAAIYITDSLIKEFGESPTEYPLHKKLDTSPILKSIYIKFRYFDGLRIENGRRIDELASIIEKYYERLLGLFGD